MLRRDLTELKAGRLKNEYMEDSSFKYISPHDFSCLINKLLIDVEKKKCPKSISNFTRRTISGPGNKLLNFWPR